jgi:hypothetical protein
MRAPSQFLLDIYIYISQPFPFSNIAGRVCVGVSVCECLFLCLTCWEHRCTSEEKKSGREELGVKKSKEELTRLGSLDVDASKRR